MTRLTVARRMDIVNAYQRLGTARAAARECGVHPRVAYRWVKRWKTTGNLNDAHRTGRPPLLSEAAADMALDLLVGGGAASANQAAEMLVNKGVVVTKLSKQTVIRGVKKAAERQRRMVRVVRGPPRKMLTQATLQKRMTFCLANKKTNWKQVMFTDRKKFLFKYPGTKVSSTRWEERDHPTHAYSPNHPDVINVYAGITIHGVSRCHVVAGSSKHKTTFTNKKGAMAKNITSQEYATVLKDTLLPEGRRMFGSRGVSMWKLQQDNDPSHKVAAAVLEEWNKERNSSVQLLMDWPPNSPDLNPIENMWAVVQREVDALGCQNFAEFQEAVKKGVQKHGRKMARALVTSMCKRLEDCLEIKGCKTKY